MYIYLPDNLAAQPYSPVSNHANLVVQFMPALAAGDRDFSIGAYADARVLTSSSKYYYEVAIRYGGLTSGRDYMMQISQINTATSSFYMASSPDRHKITVDYKRYSNSHYYDSFWVQSATHFRFAQLLHTTATVSDYETLTINYMPYGALAAGSSSNEIALRLSVEARYHEADGGVTAIYTADGKTLFSGGEYSGVVSNPNSNNEVNSIQFGQYSIDNAPLRFTLAKQSAYSDNTMYTWMVPLIKNPSAAYVTLRYNLTLVRSANAKYEYVHNFYQSINEYFTVADSSVSMVTSLANNLKAVQTVSNVDLEVNLGSYSLTQWNTAIFKVNNALTGLLPSISSPNDTSNYNYYFFKNIHMVMAQKKSTSTITTVGIGAASSSLDYTSTFGLTEVRIFDNSNVPTATNPTTLKYSTPPVLTLTYLTNYASSTLALDEGYSTASSAAMYHTTFNTPIIPDGGEIRILFDNTKFTADLNAPCRVGSGFARSTKDSSALRCYRTS